jgi:protein TonB
MTVSYPLRAFDNARPLRRAGRHKPDRDRLTSIAITITVHVVILALALTAVHVTRPKVMQELSVQITPTKIEVTRHAAPPPKLTAPAPIAVPPPDISIPAPPPPVAVQQTDAKLAPPAPMAAPQAAESESRDSFLGRLLAQLNRFKQYPRSARQARIEGVVMLHFILDAQGKVLSAEIAKSSGRPVLDAEALALIQRAQPLPELPANYPTRTLDAVVPIAFSLNG